jgi:glycosyltransferase involved in cell wall biosynthesis
VRITYIHQFFATRDSDLGLIRSYEFARRWAAQGHEVTVVTGSSRLSAVLQERLFASGDVDGIDVRSVRDAYANRMSYARRVLSFALFAVGATWLALRGPRPDVVLATSTPLTVAIPGLIAARLRRVPFVFEVRDLWPEAAIQMGALRRGGIPARLAKWLERSAYRAASQVVALSPGMAEGVHAEGVSADRVHVVPNSSDIDLFSPGDKDPRLVAQYGLAGRFVVGYAGAIGPSNALETQLPAAARELAARGQGDVTFLVVGDGRSLPALRDAVTDLPGVVLAGTMPKREIPCAIRTCDVMLVLFADVPILAMNSPNKLFDALASGRPVIVNSPGWTKDLVESHQVGLYVPAGDGLALADAIQSLARDPETLMRMGDRARALAESDFSRDELAQRVLDVLERAVSGTGSHGGRRTHGRRDDASITPTAL